MSHESHESTAHPILNSPSGFRREISQSKARLDTKREQVGDRFKHQSGGESLNGGGSEKEEEGTGNQGGQVRIHQRGESL
jgi:hypothetical protein